MEDGWIPSQELWSLSHKIEFLNPTLTHKKQYTFGAKIPKYIFFFNLMLSLKNNENHAVFDEICKKKKAKVKIKFQKNEGYFFGQHHLVEKSSPATALDIFLGMSFSPGVQKLISQSQQKCIPCIIIWWILWNFIPINWWFRSTGKLISGTVVLNLLDFFCFLPSSVNRLKLDDNFLTSGDHNIPFFVPNPVLNYQGHWFLQLRSQKV